MPSNSQQSSILEKVAQSVNSFEATSKLTMLPMFSDTTDIIDHLVSCVRPIDFNAMVNSENGKGATILEKTVMIIDEFIRLTDEHDRNVSIILGQIFIYNGVFWRVLNDNEAKNLLGRVAEKMSYNTLGSRFYGTKVRLLKQLKSTASISDESFILEDEVVLVNFRNCTLEISANGVSSREHRAEDKLTYCLPYDYEPSAVCELFDIFLNKVIPDKELQTVLLEYLGYVFTKHLKLEKVLILLGEGRNGKSVIYDIVCKLLGEENVSNFSLEEVSKDKGYCRIQLAHKRLNYGSDINNRIDSDNFKKMSSGETISARAIRCEPIEMKHYAKQMYNTNNLPTKGAEFTMAFMRRFIIIPFNVTVKEEDMNVNLAKEICEHDLPGIFNLVLGGLITVLRQKGFSKCKAADDVLDEFKDEINPLSEFLLFNDYIPSEDRSVPLKNLFEEYRSFNHQNYGERIGYRVFSKLLKQQRFSVECIGGRARQVFIQKRY